MTDELKAMQLAASIANLVDKEEVRQLVNELKQVLSGRNMGEILLALGFMAHLTIEEGEVDTSERVTLVDMMAFLMGPKRNMS